MTLNRFITIDPGAGGGIALYKIGQESPASAFKMPAIKVFSAWLLDQKEIAKGELIVMIEHQQVFPGDIGGKVLTPLEKKIAYGKALNMQKLLNHFQELQTTCQHNGVKYLTVTPIQWQTVLNQKRIKGEPNTDRKNRYKKKASEFFPYIAVNLKTADALCMLQFLLLKLKFESEWVKTKLNHPNNQ